MIDLAFDSALEGILNQFSVPMFALDRTVSQGAFQFVCINRAMESSRNEGAHQIIGKSIHDLLPKLEADVAHTRYAQCAAQQRDLRYRDRFTTAGKSALWDTTLQHVPLNGGGDRIVGTSIKISEDGAQAEKDPAFDDIQYFSSLADLQLRNLVSTFEIFRDRDLFSVRNEQHIDKLAGMCRTVQRAVEDIKKVVHTTPRPSELQNPVGRSAGAPIAKSFQNPAGSDTVGVLFADVADDARRSG